MIEAIIGGACLLAIIAVYWRFGAHMTARQKDWLPASTALVRDRTGDTPGQRDLFSLE